MLEAIIENIVKERNAVRYHSAYTEITEDTKFRDDEVFVCMEHSSVGSPTGYISDDELIEENHFPDNKVMTQNTGFIRFFGADPIAKGYLVTILEDQETVFEVITNDQDEIQKLKAYQ